MKHELKTLPNYFEAINRGEKRFEIRDNSDRGFQKGDLIIFREYDLIAGYLGRELMGEISYVTNYQQPANQVVFGFTIINEQPA